jgi:predicted alpha/beta-fold hydrolase
MTVVGSELRTTPFVKFNRSFIEMSDGERTVVDEVALECELSDSSPIVVLLHGLAGSSQSNYIRHAIMALTDNLKRELRVWVVHARGAARPLQREQSKGNNNNNQDDDDDDDDSDFLLRKPMFYSAAFTDDLHEVGAALRVKFPRAPKIVVGFSLGANVTSHYLAEVKPADNPFLGGVGVCNPYDLHLINSERMSKFPGNVYSQFLVEGLKGFLRRNYKVHFLF